MTSDTVTSEIATHPISAPKILLQLEGLALFGVATAAFFIAGGSWALFAALILVPDLSLAGYLAGRRIGSITYNAAHNMVAPLVLLGVGLAIAQPPAVSIALIALIWLAHIGIDRALGYGLKYAASFKETHLQRA